MRQIFFIAGLILVFGVTVGVVAGKYFDIQKKQTKDATVASLADGKIVDDMKVVSKLTKEYYYQAAEISSKRTGQAYRPENRYLPTAISDLSFIDQNFRTGLYSMMDYEDIAPTAYKLCADFSSSNLDLVPDDGVIPKNEWIHGKGYYCFEQRVDEKASWDPQEEIKSIMGVLSTHTKGGTQPKPSTQAGSGSNF